MNAERKAWRFLSATTRRLAVLLGGALLIVAACQQPFDSGIGDVRGSSAETGGSGATTGGDSSSGDPSTDGSNSSGDYTAVFLPPLADDTGDADAGVRVDDLAVRVRGVDSEGNTLDIPDFTADGRGSERLREASDVQHGDYYIVNFHLRRYVDAGSSLKIEIVRGDSVLASLDAEVVATGREAREVSDAVALVSNRTVPVKFRVEKIDTPTPDVPPAVVGIEPEPDSDNPVEIEIQEYQLLLEGDVDPEDFGDDIYFRVRDSNELPGWIRIVDEHDGIVEVDPATAPQGDSDADVDFYTSFNEDPALDPDEGSTYGAPFGVTFYVFRRPVGD